MASPPCRLRRLVYPGPDHLRTGPGATSPGGALGVDARSFGNGPLRPGTHPERSSSTAVDAAVDGNQGKAWMGGNRPLGMNVRIRCAGAELSSPRRGIPRLW